MDFDEDYDQNNEGGDEQREGGPDFDDLFGAEADGTVLFLSFSCIKVP